MNIYTDGSGKTGKYIFFIPKTNFKKIFRKPGLTNNEAEYHGVIEALKHNRHDNVRIISDSQLIVNQLNKRWKIKEPRLKPLAEQIWRLCEDRIVEFKWVPRERNFAGKILG